MRSTEWLDFFGGHFVIRELAGIPVNKDLFAMHGCHRSHKSTPPSGTSSTGRLNAITPTHNHHSFGAPASSHDLSVFDTNSPIVMPLIAACTFIL